MFNKKPAFGASTAFMLGILYSSASSATSIPSGTYVSTFGGGNCGMIVSTSKSLKYSYGPCGKAPTYKANKVRRRGNNVSIDKASFKKFEIDAQGNLRGRWVFGNYSSMHIFQLKK